MPVVLRPAHLTDHPAVVQLMNTAYRGTGPNASWNTESVYLDGDRTSLSALLDEQVSHPDSVLLVVESACPQGCVRLEPIAPELWHLSSLAVDPLQQKSGLGRELLAAAEQWAADRGARKIHMSVIHVRHTLIAWYQRRGYHLTGEIEPFPYGDNRFGIPLRDDLSFVVLEKSVKAVAPRPEPEP